MNTKLTLSLNKDVIEMAKTYAKENNISLSFLVENYLLKIISELQSKEESKGSIVNELAGIINFENQSDFKDEYVDYLIEKYK